MIGMSNGVVAKLSKTIHHNILSIHCSAHKLELAYRDALKNIKLYDKVSSLLLSLYLFYCNSPLNRHQLKKSFSVLDRTAKMPSRVAETRWLPHTLRAITVIVDQGYGPIVAHLSELVSSNRTEKGAKARNFLKALKQKDTVLFLHFLWDIVKNLSKISLAFQCGKCTIFEIAQHVTSTVSILQSYKDRYGDASVRELCDKSGIFYEYLCSAKVDPSSLPDEWIEFKASVYGSFDNLSSLSWKRLSCFQTKCPGVLLLIDLILCLPASSAEAERGFSKMKLVKTDGRSRLLDHHLTDLVEVQVDT